MEIIDFNKAKKDIDEKSSSDSNIFYDEEKGDAYELSRYDFIKYFKEYEKYVCSPKKNTSEEKKIEVVFEKFSKMFLDLYNLYEWCNYKMIEKFKEVFDYSITSGGKRFRPFLVFIGYYLFSDEYNIDLLERQMLAIEYIHTYSLIHDDLPCMDNDELRRGLPTVWKKFGVDMAVLAGDFLLTFANQIMLDEICEKAFQEFDDEEIDEFDDEEIDEFDIFDDKLKELDNFDDEPPVDLDDENELDYELEEKNRHLCDAISNIYSARSTIYTYLNLLNACSLSGMLGGQVADILHTNNSKLKLSDIEYIYSKKTGELIKVALLNGAALSEEPSDLDSIAEIGKLIGKAYQIKDDLLEVESTTEKIGKSVDSDKNKNKITYVSIAGIEESKNELSKIHDTIIVLVDKLKINSKKKIVFKKFLEYIWSREK